jgi:hypothetical protein
LRRWWWRWLRRRLWGEGCVGGVRATSRRAQARRPWGSGGGGGCASVAEGLAAFGLRLEAAAVEISAIWRARDTGLRWWREQPTGHQTPRQRVHRRGYSRSGSRPHCCARTAARQLGVGIAPSQPCPCHQPAADLTPTRMCWSTATRGALKVAEQIASLFCFFAISFVKKFISFYAFARGQAFSKNASSARL